CRARGLATGVAAVAVLAAVAVVLLAMAVAVASLAAAALTALATIVALATLRALHAGGTLGQRLHGQLDAALLVGLQHLHAHHLAFLEVVVHVLHALVGDLADVQQTVLAGQQVDQGAEVQDLGDRAFIDLAHFHFRSNLLDAALGLVGLGGVVGGDG